MGHLLTLISYVLSKFDTFILYGESILEVPVYLILLFVILN